MKGLAVIGGPSGAMKKTGAHFSPKNANHWPQLLAVAALFSVFASERVVSEFARGHEQVGNRVIARLFEHVS